MESDLHNLNSLTYCRTTFSFTSEPRTLILGWTLSFCGFVELSNLVEFLTVNKDSVTLTLAPKTWSQILSKITAIKNLISPKQELQIKFVDKYRINDSKRDAYLRNILTWTDSRIYLKYKIKIWHTLNSSVLLPKQLTITWDFQGLFISRCIPPLATWSLSFYCHFGARRERNIW